MCGITPTSKRGQIVYMFIMLLIPLIPIFALITQNMLLLNNIIVRKADLISSDQSVLKSDETAKLIRWVRGNSESGIPSISLSLSAKNIVVDRSFIPRRPCTMRRQKTSRLLKHHQCIGDARFF